MDYRELSELQLDAFREIGNIGAGNAATALSQMTGKRIDITVPQVDVLPIQDIIGKLGAADDLVAAVVLRVFGDAPGNMFFLLTHESSINLLKMLTGQDFDGQFTEFQLSALRETGNILTGAYISSIAKLTNMNFVSSVPAVSIDMLASLITTIFIETGQVEEYMISLETKLFESNRAINGFFFYIPEPGSLEKIMKTIGLMK